MAVGRAEIRAEPLGPLAPGLARVRTITSGISRGTESLVFHGRVPQSEWQRMRAPFQAGDFPFPVKYGYSSIGEVIDGPPAWLGKRVFSLSPHQTLADLPVSALGEVPGGVPTARAVLAANMETALNAVWDADVGAGDRVAVIGAGVVGALITRLAARIPGTRVTLVDVNPARARLAPTLGAAFALPSNCPRDCDAVFHASATAAGLATALTVAGDEARVIELSWYGDGEVSVPLGQDFHVRRLQLISSQVGRIAASRRPRWDFARRRAAALDLLADDRLDALLAPPVRFVDLPARLPEILAPGSGILAQVVVY
ncbi:MAG: zinc-binding alcohol dehydrogenase [Hyphomicrobiaceae bacterium]|nr:zinc-binding alcohol dehydrogenase [Hyphomicrobiaceae bacterium]